MTPDIRMRRATHDDITEIISLLVDDNLGKLRERPGDPAYLAAFEAIDRDPNQVLAVAESGGDIAGCLQLTFIPGLSRGGQWRGHIEAVRVRRSLRSQGIGKAMMEWAIGKCRERGCGLVQLTTDKQRTDAHRFYHRLGFAATHEGMKLRF